MPFFAPSHKQDRRENVELEEDYPDCEANTLDGHAPPSTGYKEKISEVIASEALRFNDAFFC